MGTFEYRIIFFPSDVTLYKLSVSATEKERKKERKKGEKEERKAKRKDMKHIRTDVL